MKIILKASELELAQIGFKGESLSDKAAKDLKDARDQAFAKLDKKRKNNSKGSSRTDAFIINSNEVQQAINENEINLDEILHYQKILIALNYQFILFKTLKYSLHKLGKRGGISDSYLKDFIEKFIPIAYIRIPLFREKFLDVLIESFSEEDKNYEVEGSGENEESCKETTGDNSEPQFTSRRNSISKKNKQKKNDEIEEWFRTEFPKKNEFPTEIEKENPPEEELKHIDGEESS